MNVEDFPWVCILKLWIFNNKIDQKTGVAVYTTVQFIVWKISNYHPWQNLIAVFILVMLTARGLLSFAFSFPVIDNFVQQPTD